MIHDSFITIWLVVLTILENMKVNGRDYHIYYGKKMKPPTSHLINILRTVAIPLTASRVLNVFDAKQIP